MSSQSLQGSSIFFINFYPARIKTFARAQLMDEFWGVDSYNSLREVNVYVDFIGSDCIYKATDEKVL